MSSWSGLEETRSLGLNPLGTTFPTYFHASPRYDLVHRLSLRCCMHLSGLKRCLSVCNVNIVHLSHSVEEMKKKETGTGIIQFDVPFL